MIPTVVASGEAGLPSIERWPPASPPCDGDAHGVHDLRQQGHDPHAGRLRRGRLAVDRAVAARLAPLCHDHVGAAGRRGARVPHRRDHGHDLDAAPMAVVDQPGLEPAEGRREDRRPLLEHHPDGGVHEIGRPSGSGHRRRNPEALAKAVEHLLGSAQRRLRNRVGIDGRPEGVVQPQVHAERTVRQLARAVDHFP